MRIKFYRCREIEKKAVRVTLLVTVGAITCLIGACGENGVMSRFMLKSDRIIIERRPDPAYDKLFPYYVELCATSQFRSRARAASLVMRSCTSKEPARMSGLRSRNYDGVTRQRLSSRTRNTASV